jgi:hypothetical protein
MLQLLQRIATTRIGVSPSFDDLAETAKALRYARIALVARTTTDQKVIAFDNSVLGVAAVSAPEVTARLADVLLTGFDGVPHAEREVLFETFRVWADAGVRWRRPQPRWCATRTPFATGCGASRNAPGGH